MTRQHFTQPRAIGEGLLVDHGFILELVLVSKALAT
jgi:hypothetical protein